MIPGRSALVASMFVVAACGAMQGTGETSERPTPPHSNRPGSGPPGLQALSLAVRTPARTDTARLLLHVPGAAAPRSGWPLVLYLHGGSHRGSDLDQLKQYGMPRRLADGWEPPFMVAAPQLPEGEIWSDANGLIGLIDRIAADHPVDPRRVYVTGMSMGGRGAWYVAWRRPDRIAAIAPVAAYDPVLHWPRSGRLSAVPVRSWHGEDDPVAPLAEAVAMHEALIAAGGTSTLNILPGRAHDIVDVFEDDDLYRWLLSHLRPD